MKDDTIKEAIKESLVAEIKKSFMHPERVSFTISVESLRMIEENLYIFVFLINGTSRHEGFFYRETVYCVGFVVRPT